MSVNPFEIEQKLREQQSSQQQPAPQPATVQQPDPNTMVEDAFINVPDIPRLPADASMLPQVGAIAGGIYAGMRANAPQILRNLPGPLKVPGRVIGTLVPSAVGTAGGTVIGTTAEQQIEGRNTLTVEGAKEILNNSSTEVLYDVGGNLVFKAAGKVWKIGGEATKGLRETFPDPRQAAQVFLNQYGGTLTQGQLLGGFRETIESFIKGPLTKKFFDNQQVSVDEALARATIQLRDMMPGTPAFRATLGQINAELFQKYGNNPQLSAELSALSAGEAGSRAFSAAMKETQKALSDSVTPFYEKLAEKGKNINIDITALTDMGKAAKKLSDDTEGFIDLSEMMGSLARLGQKGSEVDLATLHKMRSQLAGKIIDAQNPFSAIGSKHLDEMTSLMSKFDNIIDGHAAKLSQGDAALLKEYKEITAFYKNSKKNMFGDTLTQAVIHSPDGVGKLVFDTSSLTALQELKKSVKIAETLTAESVAIQNGLQRGTKAFDDEVAKIKKDPTKYGALNSEQILNNVRQGYMQQFLSSPEKLLRWAKTVEKGSKERGVMYGLFSKEQAQVLENIANAARVGKKGTEESIGIRQMVVGGTATSVIALGTGAFSVLSPEMQDKIADTVGPAAVTSLGLLMSQRSLARAMTDPDAVSALAKLTDYRSSITGGALFKTVIEPLVRGGYFDDINKAEEDERQATGSAMRSMTSPTQGQTGIVQPSIDPFSLERQLRNQ